MSVEFTAESNQMYQVVESSGNIAGQYSTYLEAIQGLDRILCWPQGPHIYAIIQSDDTRQALYQSQLEARARLKRAAIDEYGEGAPHFLRIRMTMDDL